MTERVYYEHTRTGDRGYLHRSGDRDVIRIDRPNDPMPERPFNTGEWRPVRDSRPMSPGQTAQVAFEADKRLCLALGLHQLAKRDWLNLSDEKRIAWMEEGPADEPRRGLYLAIREFLLPLEKSE